MNNMLNWQKLIIMIIMAAILAAGGWYVYNYLSNKPAGSEIPQVTNEPVEVEVIPITEVVPEPPIKINQEEQILKTLCLSFVSRFGSYANSIRFQNLKDLDYLYTPRMKYWVDNIINSSVSPADYYSVTTRALSVEILEQNNAAATVMVNTQRQEVFTVGGEAQISYQKILLQLEKTGADWKVDSAVWQK